MYITVFKISILLIVLFLVINITKKFTKSYVKKNSIDPNRAKLILNSFYLGYILTTFLVLLLIFEIDFKQFSVFVSSILAVIGVAFFAQWSILSNITASIILFFNHPIRIGSIVRILDKEYNITGEVKNITAFYTLIYVKSEDKHITIPNIIILYKGIELMNYK